MDQPTKGYKTTEFWLTLLAVVVSAVVAVGVVPTESPWGKALAVVGAVLASLGYTVARSSLKKGPPTAVVALALGALLLSGCCSTATCYLAKAHVALSKVDQIALQEIGKVCMAKAEECRGKPPAECPGWSKCNEARNIYKVAVDGVDSHLAVVNRTLVGLGVP